jgi:hypothetical protein
MERLATLVVTGLGVGVVVDELQVPLGLLELHLLILFHLEIHLLFALPLAGRRTILAQLLLLLVELLCELLDFPALFHVVARGVMHRTTRATVVVARCLTGAFVTLWTSTPDRRSSCCGGGSSSQRLVIAIGLLLLVVLIFAPATLGCSAFIRLATLPHLWGRWGVTGTALSGLAAFVHQAEEFSDILGVVRGELLQHLLIPYSPTE